MASTINATTSGVVTTGDSVATLSLQTGGTTAVAIDTAQIVTLSKSLALLGSSSGSVSIAAPATAGTQSYTLPTAVPAVSGYALTATTGGVMSWAAASASPGGSTTQVQYNNGGAFAGSANMTFDGTTLTAAGFAGPFNGTVGATTANTGTFSSTVHKGATSGTITLTAPAVAGTQSYTLPTAVPASNGYVLSSTTAGVMSWAAAGSGSPGGSTTQVQYNNSGAFAGSANMTFDGTGLTSGNYKVTSSTIPTNGLYLPGTNQVGIALNSAAGFTFNTDSRIGFVNSNTGLNSSSFSGVTGTYNVWLGSGAGNASATTATQNVIVGDSGGSSITTGNNNTLIGCNAGGLNTSFPITTGSRNVCIGFRAGPSAAGGDDQIVIGQVSGKGNATAFIGGASGAYNAANTTTWATTSDQRIKKNVVNVGDSLAKINALRPVEFDYKENDKHEVGFIAQEFQQVFPEQITTHDPNSAEKEWVGDDKVFAIQQNLVPFLVKAMQELSTALDSANARIAALEAK